MLDVRRNQRKDAIVRRTASLPTALKSARRLAFGAAAVIALMVPGAAAAAPDYLTSTSTGNPIVPGVTDTGNHADDATTSVTLPFAVSFYGASYTTAQISSNGNLQFTGNTSEFGNNCLPETGPQIGGPGPLATIFALQGDLRTDTTGAGVFSTVTGTAPHRQFVLEWRTTHYASTNVANFEVILNEGSPTISVIYGRTDDGGSSEVTGVQNDPGLSSQFTQFSCRTAVISSGLRVDYTEGGPKVTTGPTSGTSQTAITLNGTINPGGSSANYHFEYGLSTSYGTSTAVQSAGNANTDIAASATVSGLQPNTTYHYRLVGVNGAGTASNGADATFTTAAVVVARPVVMTGPASAVTRNSAVLTGSVDTKGQPTTYAFQFGATTSYGGQSATVTLPASSTTTAVNAALSNLPAGRTFHYRLVANNRSGTTNGADMTFTTSAPGHPSASVAGLSSRACVSTSVLARITAHDSSRLLRVRVTVDGRQVALTTRSHFNARVNVATLRAGHHVLRVSVTDVNGAHAFRSISFNRCVLAATVAIPPFTG